MPSVLKIPVQTKYGTPTCMPVRLASAKATGKQSRKSVTPVMSLTRSTRDAKAPNAGTRRRSRTAWRAEVYAFPDAPTSVRISDSRTVLKM
jgi:hypothetical protein